MTGLQMLLLYIAITAARLPRIKERWIAPLMRGPEWFFDVAVPPDFVKGPGQALLRHYRWRLLLIPWGIEGLILAALCFTGRNSLINILLLIFLITLFTRFNYYAARIATENRTRPFEKPMETQPSQGVVLSLQPRTLRSYTNWWLEAGILMALGGATGWLANSSTWPDPAIPRRLTGLLLINIYVQVGLLLVKRGVINSSSAAPADNAKQYLTWRESLRRFATGICDLTRLLFSLQPLLAMGFIAGGSARWAATIGFGAVFTIALGYEWWSRLKHLEVARRTRPAKFPLLAAAQKTRGLVGFWPSLPLVLLRTANGYALNLASVPMRIAGLYFAGFAGLWLWLAR